MQKAATTGGRTKRAIPPTLPALGVVRAPKAKIFKIRGDEHVLEKIGEWLPKDREITAVDVQKCTLDGKPCTAVIFEVPDKLKPLEKVRFALVKADVLLKPTKH